VKDCPESFLKFLKAFRIDDLERFLAERMRCWPTYTFLVERGGDMGEIK